MTSVFVGFDLVLVALRWIFLVLAAVMAVVCLVDWLVRTRRINPFNPIARFFRATVDPALAPIERRVVRSGGLPTSAPWWALAAIVVGGIVILSLLGFVRNQLLAATMVVRVGGASGVYVLVVRWTIAFLQAAIIVRVVSSLFRLNPYGRWLRWSYRSTEWLLGPLRRVIPPLGMIDISPLVAYFLLSIAQWFLLQLANVM